MRKEMKIIEKTITNEEIIYISKDGREFTGIYAEDACLEHEKEIDRQLLDAIEMKELSGYLPVNIDYDCENWDSYWYKINDKEDWKLINEFYTTYDSFYCNEPKSYPEILCVVEEDDYSTGHWLSNTIDEVKRFFKLFGIECELKGEPK